jgi:hypothetical protein
MSPVNNYYLTVIIAAILLFSLLALLTDWALGRQADLLMNLIYGGVVGLTINLILRSYHIQQIRNLGISEITDEVLSSQQQIEVLSPLSETQLIARLQGEATFSNMQLSRSSNHITLRTKASAETLGEVIQIKLEATAEGMNRFLISSRPKYLINYFDLGQNLKNVVYLQNLIAKP